MKCARCKCCVHSSLIYLLDPHGSHSLAILKISGDCDSLEKALADVLKEAGELQSLEVNESTNLGGGGCCEVSSNCTHLGSNTHEL